MSQARTVMVPALADVHTHLREGNLVGSLLQLAEKGGADVLGAMPNTAEGLKSASQVLDYFDHAASLKSALKVGVNVFPFLMITEETTVEEIEICVHRGIYHAKVYPRFRTTNSKNGVVQYGRLIPIIKRCGELGMTVHFHPEHPSPIFSNRDAEFAFLPIVRLLLEETQAKIFWEHGTDARCIPHWVDMANASSRFFVTLTAHHLVTTEDRTFGDVRSVCKPPIKLESDRQGLVELIGKNYPWVMAGGDSAFHPKTAKHVDAGTCSCGAFTSPFLLPLYAHALDDLLQTEEGIRTFVRFTSGNAGWSFGLRPATKNIKLIREEWKIPLSYEVGDQIGLPFWAGQKINWQIKRDEI